MIPQISIYFIQIKFLYFDNIVIRIFFFLVFRLQKVSNYTLYCEIVNYYNKFYVKIQFIHVVEVYLAPLKF